MPCIRSILAAYQLDDATITFLTEAIKDASVEDREDILQPFLDSLDLEAIVFALDGFAECERDDEHLCGDPLGQAHSGQKSTLASICGTAEGPSLMAEPFEKSSPMWQSIAPIDAQTQKIQIYTLSGEELAGDMEVSDGMHVVDLYRQIESLHGIEAFSYYLFHEGRKLSYKDTVPAGALLTLVRDRNYELKQQEQEKRAALAVREEMAVQAALRRKRDARRKPRMVIHAEVHDATEDTEGALKKAARDAKVAPATSLKRHPSSQTSKKYSFVECLARRSQKK